MLLHLYNSVRKLRLGTKYHVFFSIKGYIVDNFNWKIMLLKYGNIRRLHQKGWVIINVCSIKKFKSTDIWTLFYIVKYSWACGSFCWRKLIFHLHQKLSASSFLATGGRFTRLTFPNVGIFIWLQLPQALCLLSESLGIQLWISPSFLKDTVSSIISSPLAFTIFSIEIQCICNVRQNLSL